MKHSQVYVGNLPVHINKAAVDGQFVEMDGAGYYRISNYDKMRPFFMTIVSDSNHWMFISSTGGLTAGRKNAEFALFPYYTVDKIHEGHETTGSKTLLLVSSDEKKLLWEPFSNRYQGVYQIERNLYKSLLGNAIIFEEVNHDLGLTFRYSWRNSEQFGFVKQSSIANHADQEVAVTILDGIQNILPAGVESGLQSNYSTLLNAYKKHELEENTGLGIFRLSSLVTDTPEPSESLKATTVWCAGISPAQHLLSSLQLDQFRSGLPVASEFDVRAEKGAYFVQVQLRLASEAEQQW